jgi:hypothetical protein
MIGVSAFAAKSAATADRSASGRSAVAADGVASADGAATADRSASAKDAAAADGPAIANVLEGRLALARASAGGGTLGFRVRDVGKGFRGSDECRVTSGEKEARGEILG